MLLFKGISYATPLAALHKLCFIKSWSQEEFIKILSLSTTFGFGDEKGFILCADLKEDIEILTLAVHPSYRRQGVASMLLKDVQHFLVMQRKQHIFLEVNATNVAAQKLYLKHGFKQTGMRKNYYHENHETFDALCLTWENPEQNLK